jgi:hypothetical protein
MKYFRLLIFASCNKRTGHFVSKLFVVILLATINILLVHFLIIAFILSSIIGYFQQIIVERFAHFASDSWTRVRIYSSRPQQLGGGSGTIANSSSQVDENKISFDPSPRIMIGKSNKVARKVISLLSNSFSSQNS